MTICPIAIAVGCKKCPAFKICPAKRLLGDMPLASKPTATPTPTPTATPTSKAKAKASVRPTVKAAAKPRTATPKAAAKKK